MGTSSRCAKFLVASFVVAGFAAPAFANPARMPPGGDKVNILFIMGDDIGWMQPSIYHRGLMVGETPNIYPLCALAIERTKGKSHRRSPPNLPPKFPCRLSCPVAAD